MTEQQSIAIQHPTFLAQECTHPRFEKRLGDTLIIMTVNAGFE